MTLSIAWIRKVNKCEELIIASDSRLRGGVIWDQCPKIITLPRSDSAICFAGVTLYTYPLMIQLYNAINSYVRSRERAMDLYDLRGHTLNVFNAMQKAITFQPPIDKNNELTGTEFIFGGYSWVRKHFCFWRIFYNKGMGLFEYKPPVNIGRFGPIIFAGDMAKEGRDRLREYLQSSHGKDLFNAETEGFNMEPFEILVELLRNVSLNVTIGGPPQLVKIHQHMNCRPVGVYWPEKGLGNATLLGRKLFEFEDSDYWFLDPVTLMTERKY